MYHCHVHFHLTGRHCRVFDIIKEISPFEHFTHEFSETEEPGCDPMTGVDVILVNLCEECTDRILRELSKVKPEAAELIVLAEKEQMELLTGFLPEIRDIWIMPMFGKETEFRFRRWQETFREGKELWQTSHFLEATINNVPNLIWYKDKNGIHEKVNDSFCRAVNKTKKQVEGRRHAYIWDVEEDDPACIESERQVMTKKKTYISEETVKTGEGIKLLTTYKSPLYDLDGSVMGTVGVAIDITQERAYEMKIMQKNKTLETIFATLDCGVMCHTVDGKRILSVNRAALEILGYDTQEEMEKDGFNMIAASVVDEDKEVLGRAIRELRTEGETVSVEYRVCHKDGEMRHVMGNIKLLSENGEPMYQRFLLDVTEKKLKEKENERRQMEMIHALSLDYNLVCFFDLDADRGTLIRADENKTGMFESVFSSECSYDENLKHYIDKFVYEEDKEMLQKSASKKMLQSILADDSQHHVNHRTYTDGEMKYFQMKIVRAGTWGESHGIVLGICSVDEEIRHEMEQKSLLEDALMQANRASRAKSEFLSNMSHDIRTPMNAIVGFTALAITNIEKRDKVEEYLQKIMTSGNHLLSLINDVLDMSRIESGKMRLEEKPCHLPDIMHGLRNIVQADVHAKQLELYIDTVDVIDEDIYCDKLRLNQVLLNLLGNSVKYTGAGGIISVRITQRAGAPAGYANYEFTIRDTGIGMSEKFVEHIFEPFERENNTTISGIQGTGLGMAITKNIVDMMDGSISVKSEQGVGTEFSVAFTFRLGEDEKEVMDIPQLRNCRALVVDDDFNTCDSVSYMLGQIGMRAEWTMTGKEAVLRTRQAVMRGDSYSAYIIDWMLPDLNGMEVTRRIRKEMGDEVPIIVLTAYDWSDIEEEADEAGVTAFCSKPLFLSELRSCLYSIVNAEGDRKDEDGEEADLPTGRILLAEDNALNQEIAVEILGSAGFEVEVAGNGQIAVDMLAKSGPGYYQLVLMDIQMPVMDGYEAVKKIRKFEDETLSGVPIFAMTANAFEEDKQKALKCGMNGHIAKPINIKELLTILRKALKNSSAERRSV